MPRANFETRSSGLARSARIVVISPDKQDSPRRLANPASVDSIPSSAMQEDHVSMGWSAARKLREGSLVKGCHVADLLIEQPTKFQLVVDGAGSPTIGLTIRQSILTAP